MARITSRGSSTPGAMSNGIGRLLGRNAMRQLFRAYGRRRRFADTQLLVEPGKDGLDAGDRIRSDVDIGGFLSIAQAARGIVQLDLAGLPQ